MIISQEIYKDLTPIQRSIVVYFVYAMDDASYLIQPFVYSLELYTAVIRDAVACRLQTTESIDMDDTRSFSV